MKGATVAVIVENDLPDLPGIPAAVVSEYASTTGDLGQFAITAPNAGRAQIVVYRTDTHTDLDSPYNELDVKVPYETHRVLYRSDPFDLTPGSEDVQLCAVRIPMSTGEGLTQEAVAKLAESAKSEAGLKRAYMNIQENRIFVSGHKELVEAPTLPGSPVTAGGGVNLTFRIVPEAAVSGSVDSEFLTLRHAALRVETTGVGAVLDIAESQGQVDVDRIAAQLLESALQGAERAMNKQIRQKFDAAVADAGKLSPLYNQPLSALSLSIYEVRFHQTGVGQGYDTKSQPTEVPQYEILLDIAIGFPRRLI